MFKKNVSYQVCLPKEIPAAFQSSYTPIESAGRKEQIQHLAFLLSTQMTNAGIGIGIEKTSEVSKFILIFIVKYLISLVFVGIEKASEQVFFFVEIVTKNFNF